MYQTISFSPILKQLFFFAFVLLLLPCQLLSQWEEIPMPQGDRIYGIETDDEVVLASTSSGIYRWKAGEPWKKCRADAFVAPGPYLHYENGIFYVNEDYTIFSTEPIVYSSDQGDTWQEIKNYRFKKWSFLANGTAQFGVINDSLFRSTDFGENWSYLPDAIPPNTVFRNYLVLGDTIAVFLNNRFTRSFDSGNTWESLQYPEMPASNVGIRAVPGFWYARFNQESFYRSYDNGNSWEPLGNSGSYDKITRIGDRLYSENLIHEYYSDDLGHTWTSFKTPGYSTDYISYQGKLMVSSIYGLHEDAGNFLWHSLNKGLPAKTTFGPYSDEIKILEVGNNLLTSSGHYSGDNGNNWYLSQTAQGIGDEFTIEGDTIICTNKNNNGTLLLSKDGGKNWALLPTGNINNLTNPVLKGDTLFALAIPDKVWFSIDLGQSWSEVALPSSGIKVLDIGTSNGYLYLLDGSNKKIYRTNDNFQTLNHLSDGFPNQSYLFMFINDAGAFIASGQTSLYHYDEGVAKWVLVTGGLWNPINHIEAIPAHSSTVALFRNDYQELFLSPDNGQNWYNSLIAGPYLYPTVIGTGMSDEYLFATIMEDQNNNRHLLRRPLSGIKGIPVTGRIYDIPAAPIVVRLRSGNGVASPAPNSFYELHGCTGQDTVEIAPVPGYSGISPDYWPVFMSGKNIDFYMGFPDPICQMSLTAYSPFKPGNETQIAFDLGCLPDTGLSVTAKVFLPVNLTFSEADPVPTSINGGTITWNNLPQNNNGFPEINLTVVTDNQAIIGDMVTIPGEFKKGNQTHRDTLFAQVVSAFDPNDKQCFPTRLSPQQGQQGALLDYTIRFQNTGNASAETVRILDTISERIDFSSIQFIAASHPVAMQLKTGKTLEFLFSNIMLPDSNSNEPASHGFVRFTARSKPGLSLGDSVLNRAAIYFDLNTPIITNTCSSVVESIPSGVDGKLLYFSKSIKISPNPSSDQVILSVEGQSLSGATITISDETGKKIIQRFNHSSDNYLLPVSTFPAGIWYVSIVHDDWLAIGKLCVFH